MSPFVREGKADQKGMFALPSTEMRDANLPPAHSHTHASNVGVLTQRSTAEFKPNSKISSPAPNLLPTPIKVKNLEPYLQGYDQEMVDQEMVNHLLSGFTYGFRLGCITDPSNVISKNHGSCFQNPNIIESFIQEGLDKGRIAGPFHNPPFPNFISSPLGVVPKSDPGKFRVIHDLSFPRDNCVNLNIPADNSKVQYDSIDQMCGSINVETSYSEFLFFYFNVWPLRIG
jgi:hypothetical protein